MAGRARSERRAGARRSCRRCRAWRRLGLGSVDSTSEMGIIVPAATPAPIVQKLNQITVNAVRTEPFRSRLNEQGFFPLGTSTDEWRAHIDVEIAKWTKIIEAGNVKPE